MSGIKRSLAQIEPMNKGVSEYTREEINPSTDVGTTNTFATSEQKYTFSVEGNERSVDTKDYFRTRMRYLKSESTQLKMEDLVAPAMNTGASLYQGGYIKLEGREISGIKDYLPQADTLYKRLTKGKSYLDGMGSSVNFWDADFNKRLARITSDGVVYDSGVMKTITYSETDLGFDGTNTAAYDAAAKTVTFATGGGAALPVPLPFAKGDKFITAGGLVLTVMYIKSATVIVVAEGLTNEAAAAGFSKKVYVVDETIFKNKSNNVVGIEIIWTPSFGFFTHPDPNPQGTYQLVMNPYNKTDIKKAAIESSGADKTPGTDFDIDITEVKLFRTKYLTTRIKDGPFFKDFDEIEVQAKTVNLGSASSSVSTSISPSTQAIAIAFQDNNAGSDSRYPRTRFIIAGGYEKKLTRLQLSFAGQSKPDPIADIEFLPGTGVTQLNNYYSERYVENFKYCGLDSEDPESFDDWLERGPFFYYPFPRDGSNMSERITVRVGFTGATGTCNMLIFEFKKRLLHAEIKGAKTTVIDVRDR
jgi:hypothetical protein